MRAFAFIALLASTTAAFGVAACRKSSKPSAATSDAAAASAAATSVPVASFLARILDAGPRVDAGPSTVVPPILDAGPLACRAVQGPLQQPFTGPAALVARDTDVEIVVHRNGVVKSTTVAAEPVATAKPERRELPGVTPEKASKPACAVAGPYAYCSDANGDIHRSLRAQANPTPPIIAHADAGARVVAAPLAGAHFAVGYLGMRKTSEGRVSEAYAKVDDADPVRISDEGSGATDLAFIERGTDVLAVLLDARRAMSPLHARVLGFPGQLALGPDMVVYVGGGGDHQVFTALGATKGSASAFALMPLSTEDGFGLVSVLLEDPPRMDEPTQTSLYPNGIDAAPIAATRGAPVVYVARVRPRGVEVGSTRVLELGKLDARGVFATFGVLPTNGSVFNVAIEADPKTPGGIWLYWTDAAGSWLERRMCPP